MVKLFWHDYKYLPYEKKLAIGEIRSLLGEHEIIEEDDSLTINGSFSSKKLERLVYFNTFQKNGEVFKTRQSLLENGWTSKYKKRQDTRYSAHGLHEYKGKFNPQIVQAILNLLNVSSRAKVFDPFCGSGTTLCECSHLDLFSVGCDLNPVAIYISNAKQTALTIPASILRETSYRILDRFKKSINIKIQTLSHLSEREKYLAKWFPRDIFFSIERIREIILSLNVEFRDIYFVLVSNILRDYSLQEPADLRIRRRKSPLPEKDFSEALEDSFQEFFKKIESAQAVVGIKPRMGFAYHTNIQDLNGCTKQWKIKPKFDIAITSPPYATALPYIDTQRLSIIWLNLCSVPQISYFESILTGSRELRNGDKTMWADNLNRNSCELPQFLHKLCIKMLSSLSKNDGFRRKAVPLLLYRYFYQMNKAFMSVCSVMKSRAFFALVVGHNKTTLGGRTFNIDTPRLLAQLSTYAGWDIDSIIPLNTYQRYSVHKNNSIKKESLILLRKKT